jgi:hypothetical protein
VEGTQQGFGESLFHPWAAQLKTIPQGFKPLKFRMGSARNEVSPFQSTIF